MIYCSVGTGCGRKGRRRGGGEEGRRGGGGGEEEGRRREEEGEEEGRRRGVESRLNQSQHGPPLSLHFSHSSLLCGLVGTDPSPS